MTDRFQLRTDPPSRSSHCQGRGLTSSARQPAMREITMRPTRSLVRAALSASLLSTLSLVLGVSALLAECSLAIAGDNVLKQFRPITDQMLQRPDRGDWLMRRGDYRRSEEHTSELQSLRHLVCRLLLEK